MCSSFLTFCASQSPEQKPHLIEIVCVINHKRHVTVLDPIYWSNHVTWSADTVGSTPVRTELNWNKTLLSCSRPTTYWVESNWVILRPTVSRPVRLGIGLPFGTCDQILPLPFFSDNCFVVLPVGRPLWREDGSVTYSAIADWPSHWGPITFHYRLIWDWVPFLSPLTTRRDYGGSILTRLHTGYITWRVRATYNV
jgi:hypothetical protein